MRRIEKILVIIIISQVLVIAAVTLWSLVFRKTNKADAEKDAGLSTAVTPSETRSFLGIGRQRLVLKGEGKTEGATLIITVVFPYNSADRAFAEELSSNIAYFRESIAAYFEPLSASDPRLKDEEAAKEFIRAAFNEKLRAGKIEKLFFSEYLLIDPA